MNNKYSSIKKRLDFLYNRRDSEKAFEGLKKVIGKYDNIKKKGKMFSNKDAVLITYADIVKEKGVKPLKTFNKFSKKLKGINTVHFLPFFPYSSDDGFSIIDYREVDPKLGGWKDVKNIGKDFELMFDFVLNHMSANSRWFKKFLKGNPNYKNYFIEIDKGRDLSDVFRARKSPLVHRFDGKNIWTTFSKDQVDLNYKNPKVLVEMIDILLFYVKKGAKIIRLDAIAYLWKKIGTGCVHLKESHEVVKLMRDILNIVNPNVALITETNVVHKDNISYIGEDEAQMVYQFPLPPLVLHAFYKGNANYLLKWIDSIGNLPKGMCFFNFLASHDGIGLLGAKGLIPEKERKELCDAAKEKKGFIQYKECKGKEYPYELDINYFDALAEDDKLDVKRFLAAHAIAFSLAGVPGIYFHSLVGSRGWREGVKNTGIKRKINREKLRWKKLKKELKDKDSRRYKIFNGISKMLKIKKKLKAFEPEADQKVLSVDHRIFSIERGKGKNKIIALINITDEKIILRKKFKRNDLISGKKFENVLEPYQAVWISP
ncbi:sugar phosphorylase [Candidatus Woesearchaeota archaeon]|nr:sugar phosphorylase [Candidatus Woesearchaeota archaeon]